MNAHNPTPLRALLASLLLALTHAAPGDRDTSFNSAVLSTAVIALSLQPDGKIVVCTWSPGSPIAIVRLNSDGSMDPSFRKVIPSYTATTSPSEVRTIVVQPDGKILIGGPFTAINGVPRDKIARVEADGTLDTTFNPSLGLFQVQAITFQNDGKIIVAGQLNSVFDPQSAAIRLATDGTVDESFVTPVRSIESFDAFEVQPDGKIVFGGFWDAGDGVLGRGVGRLENDGSLDTSFRGAKLGGFSTTPRSLAVQPDGKIVIGGAFESVAGASRRGIARLKSDGSLDASFNPGTGLNFNRPGGNSDGRDVRSMAIQEDGKILVSGTFEKINGIVRTNVARLNSDGSVDLGFNPTTAVPRFARLALQTDGKVLLAGHDRPIVRLHGGDPLPWLEILRSGGELILSSPAQHSAGFFLESADELTSPPAWTRELSPPVTVGDQHVFPVDTSARARFYRLRKE